ncbi:diaminopimelate decarboxylase [Vibrio parahaemolyticus]|uniref:Diaminopimelate decarboxylase n=17 Tax=Vibrio TaxID=662 RepID=A0A072LFU9_VIBPH|nr:MULTISPECIES: diaminopimelate decarboxylase [Vibrio]EFO36865.1 diaminopimelate decarboxylase [Vibrio parahaemolyticus Peru-466]EFO48134.1 diaminopimelate decarboxylase [Vibrio parahaemolyticus AQ4037]EFO48569.1 diaminopimelate decarboxylase [Vibrio parahaemolyticus K5030]EJG0767482.1 diaminopimelate decarboxylase [Vibrio parahaemolyticus O5:K30]EJG0952254.1 diaminopimelate decarboxylase [Vibrio parahaemolyticus O1:K58]EJG1067115.1 diaminopimelate decarboxylase [Vibrio parahaemolyticus O1]
MDYFNYQDDGQLWAEDVPLQALAEQYGTPLYVYSRATLERHWKAFDSAVGQHPHLVCYAVKANSNLGVLNALARLGSGFDIVSGGELERVIAAGGDAKKVVFSGVGKTPAEMKRALELGIKCFNVESEPELERLNKVAGELGVIAPISLRINPDVDAKTHPYISTGLRDNKFGIAFDRAPEVYQFAQSLPNLNVQGIDCHIGSQLTSIDPFIDATDRLLALIDDLKAQGINIRHLDVGGGLGVVYRDELPPQPSDYAKALLGRLENHQDLELIFEPGRAIAANAGILLTRVEFLKHTEHKNFAIIDAAMNDLMRPALYQAWQDIVPVSPRNGEPQTYDLVGPICETGDFLGKDRALVLQEGDLLAVRSAGAYGFVMSSNYNTRTRAAEVMVDGNQSHLVRQREELTSLWQLEQILPE